MDMQTVIKAPIENESTAFNEYFKGQLKSDVALLDAALRHVADGVGKMMRPMLVMLVAKSVGGVNERTYAAASAMELLHTASLVHDDVLDESDKRRGRQSLNVKFNNNVAVLTGDYLLSQSLCNAANTGDCRIVNELANLSKSLAGGEILQLELMRSGEYCEENYLKVIDEKTASLFVCSCVCGTYSAGGSEELAGQFAEFGRYVGRCFQIKDDIFDYYDGDIGKPTGSDMREGKITLPALYVLRESGNPLLVPIREKLSKGVALDENEIESLIRISVEEGGMEYAKNRIDHYRSKAIELLPSGIQSELKDSLLAFLEYAISRTK